MQLKIKVCGITNLHDAKLCEKLGADALGFIFFPKSKRYINPEQVNEIVKKLPPFITTVGVFVNEIPENINSIAIEAGINCVQLHGEEPSEHISQIYFPCIKAFRIGPEFDYSLLAEYENCSILLDSYSKDNYGGTGIKFDWEKIPVGLRNKIILAGGIDENNITHAYKYLKPYAVDISSSVEDSPGNKNHEKLVSLFNKIENLRGNNVNSTRP